MQIKPSALAQHLQRKISPVYIITGQDNYLLENSLGLIKKAIKKTRECDEKICSIQSVEDWRTVAEEANSYSLFCDAVLLTISYDKKTIDATGKKMLNTYIQSVNPKCFIIIRAPNVPAKQLLWLTNNELVTLVIAYPLNQEAMKSWINRQLQHNTIAYDPQVPELIYQYTQGNMLACAQVIEKISLTYPPNELINCQQVLEHLSDQCDHSLFDLGEACLLGQAGKAIQIVRQAAHNKSESTLVLWMLTQEIRLLLQLGYLMQQNTDFKSACNQLKIWPQRLHLYQSGLKRLNMKLLQRLLSYCQAIDERIKSNFNTQVWNALEKLSITLSTGTLLGDECAV